MPPVVPPSTPKEHAKEDRDKIWIEVTEQSFMTSQAIEILREAHEAGHPIVIDDFGIGYSLGVTGGIFGCWHNDAGVNHAYLFSGPRGCGNV
jgi:hypothetical protein